MVSTREIGEIIILTYNTTIENPLATKSELVQTSALFLGLHA